MTTPVAQWPPANRLERGSGLLAVRRESSKLRPASRRCLRSMQSAWLSFTIHHRRTRYHCPASGSCFSAYRPPPSVKATTLSHTVHGTDKHRIHHFRKAFRTTSLSCPAICFSAELKSKTCSIPQWGQGCRLELRLMRTISNAFAQLLQLNVFFMGKIHFI